jgi:hypothetical protein
MRLDVPIPFLPAYEPPPNRSPLVRESLDYLKAKRRRDLRQFCRQVELADKAAASAFFSDTIDCSLPVNKAA